MAGLGSPEFEQAAANLRIEGMPLTEQDIEIFEEMDRLNLTPEQRINHLRSQNVTANFLPLLP